MRAHRVVFVLGFAGLAIVGTLIACNGIVGVEDVRLRPQDDDRLSDQFVEAEDTAPADTGPKPIENLLEVALGFGHTCARKPDLTVKCWGDDSSGQTGTGFSADGGLVRTPLPVGITDAIRIASGRAHSCVVRTGGTVSCWGNNQDGQIGNGLTNTRSILPEDVKGVADAKEIACGGSFSCALRVGGTVMCWGNGLFGQLGNGFKQIRPDPVPVALLDRVVAISAGEAHACAVREDGSLFCWGAGVDGQLGNGDQNDRVTPTLVSGLDGVANVAAGIRSTCALKNAGPVFCWGDNKLGQLGIGAADAATVTKPDPVTGLDAVALWAGAAHACAVKRGGTVACWGAATRGQIGDGVARPDAATTVASPSDVLTVTGAVKVGTGGNHSCAATVDTILCWGDNDGGQNGTGDAGPPMLSPASVLGYP